MNTNELISIVIPTYKNRGTLQRAVESCLKQTYRNTEIIVVDDNDPESVARKETSRIMDAYKRHSSVIYICHEHNKNGAAARNTGIRNSHGRYITFLDDDDYYLENKVLKEYSYLVDHPEFDAVYCYEYIDGKKTRVKPYEGDNSIPLLMNRAKMQTSTLMFRAESIKAINGFDESFRRHQDFEMPLRYFRSGYKIGCVNKYLVYFDSTKGGNRISGKQHEEVKERFLNIFSEFIKELDEKQPGVKNKIYASQYATVFYSHIACRYWRMAYNLLMSYFPLAPIAFVSTICNCILDKIYRQFH